MNRLKQIVAIAAVVYVSPVSIAAAQLETDPREIDIVVETQLDPDDLVERPVNEKGPARVMINKEQGTVRISENAEPAEKEVSKVKKTIGDVQIEVIPEQEIVVIRGNLSDVENAKAVISRIAEGSSKRRSNAKKSALVELDAAGEFGGEMMDAGKTSEKEPLLRVIQLKFISADDAIRVMTDLGSYDSFRITSDPSSTRLLYMANDQQSAQIEQLIEVIDTEQSSQRDSEKVFVPWSARLRPPRAAPVEAELSQFSNRLLVEKAESGDAKISLVVEDEIAQKRRDYHRAEDRVAEIASKLKQVAREESPNPIEVEQLKKLLLTAVESSFNGRIKLQEAQLAQAKAELEKGLKRLRQRQEQSREIISRRVKELTNQ